MSTAPLLRQRALAFIAVLFALALAIAYWFSWRAPAAGLYHDDGIYLVTAKALASGQGYRITSLPSAMYQTKYPFLFPALLAAIIRITPEFPHNLPALKLLPLACALLWYALSWLLLTRLGAPRPVALWMVLLTAASPMSLFLATNLMSEPLFALLCTGSLLAALEVERGRSLRWALLAGVLAGLAFLTRTIGVALLAAPAMAFLAQRRFRACLAFAAPAAALASLWPLWTHGKTAAATNVAELYYAASNYESWNIIFHHTWPEKIRVLIANLLIASGSPALLLESHPMLLAALATLLLLTLYAFRFGTPTSAHLFPLLYTALIFCWAWPPLRFEHILLPLTLLFLWKALVSLATPKPAITALTALVAAHLLFITLSRLPATRTEGNFSLIPGPTENWDQIQAINAWLREHTSPQDVVLANLDPVISLYSGRRAVRAFVPDSYKVFYAPGAPTADSVGSLPDLLRASHASYLVLTPGKLFAEAPVLEANVKVLLRDQPDLLTPVSRPNALPGYVIYRISPDRLAHR